MKYSIIFSFILAILFAAGCRKNDNPKVPELVQVPLPNITLDSGELRIPGDDPAAFFASFDVDVYYKQGLQPKSMDIVVVKNGDRANPKVLQADVTAFPTSLTITGQQLIDLFGQGIALGDAFEVGADMIMDNGTKYPGFPIGGTTYAPGIATLPGINTSLKFAAPCLFDPAAYTEGDYEVIVDEWADYQPGDHVPVTKIDDTHYSFKYVANNAQPIIMEVHPEDNSITVAPVNYGDYSGDQVTAESVPGPDTGVDPCDVSFSVVLHHTLTVGGGDIGNFKIQLRKL
jgi:hypothetical protein